jgi:hypothetical protein
MDPMLLQPVLIPLAPGHFQSMAAGTLKKR